MQATGPLMSLPITPVVRLMMTPAQAARIAPQTSSATSRIPRRQVALALVLAPDVHVHDGRAGVEGIARLGGHLARR